MMRHTRSAMRSTEIAEQVDGTHHGRPREVSRLAELDTAGPDDLAYAEKAVSGDAGVVLCKQPEPGRTCIVVKDPKRAFIQVMELWCPEVYPPGVHPTAVVEGELGEGVHIGPYAVIAAGARIGDGAAVLTGAVIGEDCVIGPRTVIFPRAVLYPETQVGADCRIHAGAVLGADGFSYHPTAQGPIKVPQVGRVRLGDRVEIGANTCVDRAKFGNTVIGAGTKIDNLCQIGHGCRVGRLTVIAGLTGLAGSVEVGDGVQMGGHCGVADHRRIGDRARLAAKSAVMDDVPDGATWGGMPAQDARSELRVIAAIRRLPEWSRRLRQLIE
jgi:UDP-3-O-[3-hydroxymyristoyl] glucosamine N-acyltransferase